MGRPKIKRRKPSSARTKGFKVRLSRHEAMELLRIGGEDLASGERHARMLRPKLSEAALKELAMRCSDPQRHGGIETGSDPDGGDWVDVLITSASR